MTYTVKYEAKVKKRIRKIDISARRKIKSWIDNNLQGCTNPRRFGKALAGRYKGLWRYRVGMYRIIAEIRDKEVIILVVDIGHRQGMYKD